MSEERPIKYHSPDEAASIAKDDQDRSQSHQELIHDAPDAVLRRDIIHPTFGVPSTGGPHIGGLPVDSPAPSTAASLSTENSGYQDIPAILPSVGGVVKDREDSFDSEPPRRPHHLPDFGGVPPHPATPPPQSQRYEEEAPLPPEARYGAVERSDESPVTIGGAAGAAVSIDNSGGVSGLIRTDQDLRGSFRAAVSPTTSDSIRNNLGRPKETAPQAPGPKGPDVHQAPDESAPPGHSVFPGKPTTGRHLQAARKYVGREIDRSITQGISDGDVDDRTAGLGTKYGYRAGKYAALGTVATIRGASDFGRFGFRLSQDVKSGVISASDARSAFFGQAKSSAHDAALTLGRLMVTGLAHEVEDFYGSEDLGIQAIVKPKDAVVRGRYIWNATRKTGSTLKKGAQVSRAAVQKAADVGRAVAALGKKVVSNPVVVKGLLIAAGVATVLMILPIIISAVVSIVTSFSLKSDDWELTQTYLYITQLDAEMQVKISDIGPGKPKYLDIDQFGYYLNGSGTYHEALEVYTDADTILAYLDSKYDDYTFAEVRAEIGELHSALHQLKLERWDEMYLPEGAVEPVIIHHLDTHLDNQTATEYFQRDGNFLLDQEQADRLSYLQEVGVYSFREELASPFPDRDWIGSVTSRFGWRIHPITGRLGTHNALDIAMPSGTPIHACMDGTAEVPPYNDSYGNYVRITVPGGNYTLYAHMSSVAVANGQTVHAGDVIGYVGTTGTSTGDHLHLEYHKDGHGLNPLFYVAR